MVVGWYHSHPGFGCWFSGTVPGRRIADGFRSVIKPRYTDLSWEKLTVYEAPARKLERANSMSMRQYAYLLKWHFVHKAKETVGAITPQKCHRKA